MLFKEVLIQKLPPNGFEGEEPNGKDEAQRPHTALKMWCTLRKYSWKYSVNDHV